MATTSIRVMFGARSSKELECEVQWIMASLPDGEREKISLVRDRRANLAIMVEVEGVDQFYGPEAMDFLRSYHDVAQDTADDEATRISPLDRTEDEFEHPERVNRLAKTRYAPFAQYSAEAPTIGHHYQYVPPTYLPEENRGLYSRMLPYALPTRFPLRYQPMHADGRTRLPSK